MCNTSFASVEALFARKETKGDLLVPNLARILVEASPSSFVYYLYIFRDFWSCDCRALRMTMITKTHPLKEKKRCIDI